MAGLHIDGSEKAGSGTIVRHACLLSALTGQELHLTNIRTRRKKAGLRPQHLKAVEAVRDMCGGKVEGAAVGASEILFAPGTAVRGGSYRWEIGTAGSATMLALNILPLACFASGPVTAHITGGLFQDYAPTALHMQNVLLPLLARMGAEATLEILRAGYPPLGGGELKLKVTPPKRRGLYPFTQETLGEVAHIGGIALSSHLQERRVSDRMAHACRKEIAAAGYEAHLRAEEDSDSLQPGAALALWAHTSSGCILGADRVGQPRRSSEQVGRQAAKMLLQDLSAGATVDRYAADQLVIFAALAGGESCYVIPHSTEHLETNLWLVNEVIGVHASLRGQKLRIHGAGCLASHAP